MKFLFPEVALCLCKFAICRCTEYCYHVSTNAPSCYLELLHKREKRICRTVGPSLATSLEPLTHRRSVANLSLFYSYYFGRCSSKLNWFHFLVLEVDLPDILIYCMIFVTIKDVYVNSFFPHAARLWNSLPIECFPVSYDLNGFKSRINRQLLTVFFLCLT